MKKFLAGLTLLPLFFALFANAAAESAEEKYKTYVNGRFGYSVNYPDIFGEGREPDNGDGIEFASDGGEYTLAVWGGHNVLEQDGYSLLEDCYGRVAHIVPGSGKSAGNYYSIEYSDDGGKDGTEHIFHEYGIVNGETKAGFTLQYPKAEEERFAMIKIDMENSLSLPEPDGGTGAREAPDIGAFALKDGRVYKEGAELDCEVNEIPSGVEGPIRFWSALGTDTSEAVRENETGVWFFTDLGGALTFVPLESEYECQDVIFSPGGGSFVLVKGSGVRPDMFFEVYGEGTEKTAEFGGIRGEIEWIGPDRFVFTSIGEDTRDGGRFFNLSYGLYLSVSMYDTAAKELTVLKEAAATLNFTLGGVTDGGKAVTVIEQSVKSEEDWADEDKIETREIRVEIPAAS
jgi:hypothetical protein